jgi:hypothetical protein
MRWVTPTVYLDVKDSGIQLTGRLLCDVRTRRGVTHRIWTQVLEAFEADPALELAYPTVRAVVTDPLRVRRDAPVQPPTTGNGEGHEH